MNTTAPTPAPSPWPAGVTRRLVRVNGIDLELFEAGTGPKLAICLHGFPEHAFSWRAQIEPLVAAGYRVWMPNQRGYGASSRPEGVEAYDISQLTADVGALYDLAAAEFAPAETMLLAHDWGGIVGWFFTIQKIRPLARAVFCNIPHPLIAARRRSFAQLRKSWYMFFFQIPRLPEKMMTARNAEPIARAFTEKTLGKHMFPPEVLQVYKDNALRPGGMTAMINWYRALLRGGFRRQLEKGVPKVTIPTLMLWGENDIALGKELSFGTEELVPGLTLRYLPGISHWVQQEAPETVNAMLTAWLNGQPVPQAGFGGRLLDPP